MRWLIVDIKLMMIFLYAEAKKKYSETRQR